MIQIDNTLISEDLLDQYFHCQLSSCKGACCVEGDRGAPLKLEEIETIQREFAQIKPFLQLSYAETIEKQGFYEQDEDGDYVTTCQPTGECNFLVRKDGVSSCGIELAWQNSATSFRKPISCHLYPVRLKEYQSFTAVNYQRWHICQSACSFGEELKMPLYKFLKEALIRRFGADWYQELEEIAEAWQQQSNK